MTKTTQEIENQKTVVQVDNDDLSDNGNDNGPWDLFDPSGESDHPDEENVQHNLADAIATSARNVQHQGDGSHSKVQEPNPFDSTDMTKLWTFFVQLQLNFNDRRKVNFAISYLKGIVLAYFQNTLIEPDLIHPVACDDNYEEFVSKLKTYFGAPDIIREVESKLENLVMKPNQCITKYLVEFSWLASIKGWDNRALQHQFYRGLPGCIKDEVSWVGKPTTLLELWMLAQQIDGWYWEQKEETQREWGGQPLEKANKSQNQQSSSSNNNQNKHQKKLFIPRDSGSSSQNTNKKMSDLHDKIGKDSKLTTAEKSHHFANNLCLFCQPSVPNSSNDNLWN